MQRETIKNVVIVGGGTAGWMAAASLSKHLARWPIQITLVESSDIGTVGVGEATLPGIRDFNNSLGLDEVEFIKATQATFKLGIEFNDWSQIGARFFHPFAHYGADIEGASFYHCWLKMRRSGKAQALGEYCFPQVMARQNKFAQPHPNPRNTLADYHYAFHFDALLYARLLMNVALKQGVNRIEGQVCSVKTAAEDGFIDSVTLASGQRLEADLFIDCSGFRGLLIEEALSTGYENWSRWLPCNSAVAIQSRSTAEPTPFTRTTARGAGWQWRIPLQHRVGNGYVFSDNYLDPDAAERRLIDSLDGEALGEPRRFKFVTGRRKAFWRKNCVALGLAGGFLEPLESTSIALVQTGIGRLLQFFPWYGFNEAEIAEANRQTKLEYERIRDFLVIHYSLSGRDDTAFWNHCRTMAIPDSLQQKLEAFQNRGLLIHYEQESFQDASWLTMYNGFNLEPRHYHPSADTIPLATLEQQFSAMHSAISQAAQQAPSHQAFIAQHCAAPPV